MKQLRHPSWMVWLGMLCHPGILLYNLLIEWFSNLAGWIILSQTWVGYAFGFRFYRWDSLGKMMFQRKLGQPCLGTIYIYIYFYIYIYIYIYTWLVVWNIFLFFHILGIYISQLTFTFFMGVETTHYIYRERERCNSNRWWPIPKWFSKFQGLCFSPEALQDCEWCVHLQAEAGRING